MIIVLRDEATQYQVSYLTDWLNSRHYKVHFLNEGGKKLIGIFGDTAELNTKMIESMDIVKSVTDVDEPYKAANRKLHPENTVIDVCGTKIGGDRFVTIAGPCSVESEKQIIEIAKAVKSAGADFLRGGAFKPRTSPYDFQGMQADGLQLLEKAKAETGLPIVSEIVDVRQLPLFDNVDIIQVGARNTQNFGLLKALGRIDKPVLLKRGAASTYRELLMSAEYIMAGGNSRVILCERGIRTFEHYTRNTLDLTAVPVLKKLSHLPVIVDPSHGTGDSELVTPMALAAVASGADGMMIEVHNKPEEALSDGAQSVTPVQFTNIMTKSIEIRKIIKS